ncbi:hypothetical protein FAEPRAA2165_02661 [Faecalibacterium duncaniae]|uniref:Uncharacterized protein n=1 Tax=Faecalibacterium duncaniae (strain DSM 17677 / JCM 31915 / A2-165) TaxID=411483 RepID=C7H8L9_FAED2|nr:hypothetical protein FAEPRAA2165_02661 [Faecalibacterium duncaniae]
MTTTTNPCFLVRRKQGFCRMDFRKRKRRTRRTNIVTLSKRDSG